MSSKIFNYSINRLLPYIIGGIGILACIALWAYLSYQSFFSLTATVLIIAILGVAILILSVITIRLMYLIKKRSESFESINKNFKKEIKKHLVAEKSKKQLERALIQGQKLQAVGTLAGGIAHDFNNILYAIIGYVEMAREDIDKESKIYSNLGKVLEAASRGQDLISRILTFSRRQHHDFVPIYIQATIENVLGLLRPTIPASVAIVFHPMQQDYLILGNQTQIHQVIVNIINNSVDAMDGEGTIALTLSLVSLEDDLLKQLPTMTNSQYIKIDISDTGHGMDQATIERIFEPFFTTKEVGKGTGLGLSTVHAIVTEHQGEIFVNSQLGQGTTFSILLPEYKENDHGKDFASGR